MATATRTIENEKMTIKITLTREVTDKTSYADGYNITIGREVHDAYDVIITGKQSGKTIRKHGKFGDFAFFETASKFHTMPAGAYARISDAYVTKEIYDLAMALIAELDAEVKKSDEQLEIEAAEKKAKEQRYISNEPKHGENGYCRKCHSYCHGDCQ